MLHMSWWKVAVILLVCSFSVLFSLPTFFPYLKSRVLPNTAVNLGLDLKGGASLVIEVDFQQYYTEKMHGVADAISKALDGIGVKADDIQTTVDVPGDVCMVQVKLKQNTINGVHKLDEDGEWQVSGEDLSKMRSAVVNAIGTRDVSVRSRAGGVLVINISPAVIQEARHNLLAQSIEIVRRRIDDAGTKEIDLQRQGDEQILLQVPGTYDTSEIRRLLGQTAKLTLHYVYKGGVHGVVPIGFKLLPLETTNDLVEPGDDEDADDDSEEGGVVNEYEGAGSSTADHRKIQHNGEQREFLAVSIRPAMPGDMILDAHAMMHEGRNVVDLKFTSVGAKVFGDITSKNVGKALAIVLDGKVISAPYVHEPILSGMCTISGNFSSTSANELAVLLRAGALPAPLKIVEERTVGPTLGKDSIQTGTNAVIIASVAVAVFMVLFYGVWGISADIALVFNILLIFAVLGVIGATLTLPGLAAIALTLGMAVDANVLICERIREEYGRGISILRAIDSGYKRSFTTIIDSNFTTIAAAVVLYIFGTGPIKGFAVSLTIGILCSIFTSVYVTKLLVSCWYKAFGFKKLGL